MFETKWLEAFSKSCLNLVCNFYFETKAALSTSHEVIATQEELQIPKGQCHLVKPVKGDMLVEEVHAKFK